MRFEPFAGVALCVSLCIFLASTYHEMEALFEESNFFHEMETESDVAARAGAGLARAGEALRRGEGCGEELRRGEGCGEMLRRGVSRRAGE